MEFLLIKQEKEYVELPAQLKYLFSAPLSGSRISHMIQPEYISDDCLISLSKFPVKSTARLKTLDDQIQALTKDESISGTEDTEE
mgnify:CR=1 FL=1